MKTIKQKVKKIINKPLKGNPIMVDIARVERLEKLVIKLAEEIDLLHEFKADKTKTSYTPAPVKSTTGEAIVPREMIKYRISEIIVDKLGVEESEVTEEASFRDDLGADSLDAVELLMDFEKEFNVAIPDEAAESVVTVKDAVDLLYKLINGK